MLADRLLMRRRRLAVSAIVIAGSIAASAAPSLALTFNFNFSGITGPDAANAMAGFQAAGQRYSNLLSDNVTININAGFATLGGNTLAQAGSSTVGLYYTDVKAALAAKAASADDAVAVANLPVGTPALVGTPTGNRTLAGLSFVTNNPTTGARVVDNNLTANNFSLDVNRANAKALGLLAANSTASDASITFNNTTNYDFDPSDGISAGKLDFVGIAAHEIGHALGFVSGADSVDESSGPSGPDAGTNLDGFRILSVLDLFRYSADSISRGKGVLDVAYGGTPYFSLDGATAVTSDKGNALFATGSFNGDGQQASHWKDGPGAPQFLGIMDPTLAAGQPAFFTSLDRRAFDAIGYTLAVPEPTTLAALAGVATIIVRRRRRA